MTTYNVAVKVVDLIDAPDKATAEQAFVKQLRDLDLEIVDGTVDAFVSDVEIVKVD